MLQVNKIFDKYYQNYVFLFTKKWFCRKI